MNEARVRGKLIGMELHGMTRSEVKLTILVEIFEVTTILSGEENLEKARGWRLDDTVEVRGRLGGGSHIGSAEVEVVGS